MRLAVIPGMADRLRRGFDRWTEAERGRFVLWMPVAATAGVVAYFERLTEPGPWWAITILAFAAGVSLLIRQWRAPAFIAALVAATALGFASAQFSTMRAPAAIEVPARATIVTGRISFVEILPAGRRVLIASPSFDDGPPLERTVRINLKPSDNFEIATGDSVRVRALLRRPASPAYPGGWDLQRDAWFSGLGAVGRALDPMVSVSRAPPETALGWVQALRETIATRIAAAIGGPAGTIATTLLTGVTSAIPASDRAAFRDSGLAHLLAIAGLHIGIVMALVFGSVRGALAFSERAALFWPLKSVAAAAALVGGLLYLVLTGAHVPIIRSFAMASLVATGVLLGRRAISLRALALAMAAIVLIAPNEVVGVSFQMSFSAVLALIGGYALLRPWLSALHGDGGRMRRLASHVAGLALTSALAGTFSAPYGAYHFGHVQIYYVLANMVAVPITAMLVLPAGLLALVLMPLHLEALALVPMRWGIAGIIEIAHVTADLPDATIAVPHMPAWGLAAFSLGLAWLGIWRTSWRLVGVLAMLAGIVSPAFDTPPDILVSADARLIGAREEGRFLLRKATGGSAFTEDAWQQFWAIGAPIPLACATATCLLQPRPDAAIALLIGTEADPAYCASGLLISAEPLRLRCPASTKIIDRFTVWRNGAHAVWLGPYGASIVSDRSSRGDRPWVLGLPLAGRIPAGTIRAEAEILPPG